MIHPNRRLMLLVALACALLAVPATNARASTTQTSIMQDDQNLIDSGSQRVAASLARMQQLGVETVRVNVEWSTIAPDVTATTPPAGFDTGDPAAANPDNYPAAGWAPYDRLVQLAPLYGISVQFNLTGPGPLWAMAPGSPTTRASTHWKPNATDFKLFALAVGERYSGNDGQPRVSDWSIWNEPNQPGWLAPQWSTVKKRRVPQSPKLYRSLLRAGWTGLTASGHTPANDTILVGETAPQGSDSGTFYTPMTPIPFLRDLYCVNARDKPLRGTAAATVGCPTTGPASSFAKANPGLFKASGFAHHPYEFVKAPNVSLPDPSMVPLSDIARLDTFLDSSFRSYGVHRRIPLYFTEYGYETNPPDPHRHVTPAEQAAYLNEADYLSWRMPRVRSVAQFLLYDSAPDARYATPVAKHWDTFQTGLLYLNGTAKPAYRAYQMPIWLPTTRVTRRGTRVLVWGQVRPADRRASQVVKVQFRPLGIHVNWHTVAIAHTRAESGYFTTHIRLVDSGTVRSVWSGTVGSSSASDAETRMFTSRGVGVDVR